MKVKRRTLRRSKFKPGDRVFISPGINTRITLVNNKIYTGTIGQHGTIIEVSKYYFQDSSDSEFMYRVEFDDTKITLIKSNSYLERDLSFLDHPCVLLALI